MRSSRAAWTAAVVALALLSAACSGGEGGQVGQGGQRGAAGSRQISVGVIPIVDVAPLYLGISRGLFARHGLVVHPRLAQGGAAIVPAVLSGEDDVGFSNVVSLLTARERGLPLVSIAAGVSSTGDAQRDVHAVLVARGSRMTSARDLVGRTVAVNSLNNIGDTTVKAAVERDGGDPTKVTFVEMPLPDMPGQLAAGAIDAAWETEPFRTQILADGGRALFDNLTATYPRVQIAQYFTSEQTAATDPALVSDFVLALKESFAYAADHPQEIKAILGSYTKISPAVAEQVVLPAWPVALDPASTTAIGDAARRYGTLRRAPDVKGLLRE